MHGRTRTEAQRELGLIKTGYRQFIDQTVKIESPYSQNKYHKMSLNLMTKFPNEKEEKKKEAEAEKALLK